MGDDGVLGEIRLFAGIFAPKNWLYCDGSTISIRQNATLFAVIGTTYGGDGVNNFKLPNFNGRVVAGAGAGPGLTARSNGDQGGADSVTVTMNEMPAHAHPVICTTALKAYDGGTDYSKNVTTPAGNNPATVGSGNLYRSSANAKMKPMSGTVSLQNSDGGTSPVGNIQPVLGLSYVICTSGLFPDRP